MVGIAVCLKGTLCAVAIVRSAKSIGEHSAPPTDLSRDNRWYVCNIVCSVEAGRHDILIGAGNGSKTCLSKVSVLNDRSAGALQPTFTMMSSHACRCALWCPLQTSQTICTQHLGRQIVIIGGHWYRNWTCTKNGSRTCRVSNLSQLAVFMVKDD